MKPTSSPKEILATAKTEDLEEDLVEQEEDEETGGFRFEFPNQDSVLCFLPFPHSLFFGLLPLNT